MKKHHPIMAALAISVLSVSALAAPYQAGDVYLFGNIGRSDFDPSVNTSGFTLDTTDNAFALGAGYRISENFSAEVGYTDQGKLSVKDRFNNKGSIEATGYFLGLKGEMMVTDSISLLARGGAFFWDAKGKNSLRNTDEDGTDPYIALGAAYHFNKQLAVDWQISRYYMEDDAGDNLDIDTVSLGLTYNF
ncbi:porin family protein [Aliamphritea hakodatensis]|uniref:porin family protein n=1 Tax=Aliamphritea hakodatensis TaxID=2895352 RepID=UPI0022FD7380|nr:porin family protein [Aliamphritea hakodatensis]